MCPFRSTITLLTVMSIATTLPALVTTRSVVRKYSPALVITTGAEEDRFHSKMLIYLESGRKQCSCPFDRLSTRATSPGMFCSLMLPCFSTAPGQPVLALAPMQDVTDLPFWRLMTHYGGADVYYTEYFRVHAT